MAVSAGDYHTVGLKADGTVVAVGDNRNGRCNVQGWSDIVAVSAGGGSHTVGLKADGTVVAVGSNSQGQCGVQDWKLFKTDNEKEKDYNEAVKLQSSVEEADLKKAYLLFASMKDYQDSEERAAFCKQAYEKKKAEREEQERERAAAAQDAERQRREAERQRMIALLNNEKAALQKELSNLKGLFAGSRRKKIEARLAQIENELKSLK